MVRSLTVFTLAALCAAVSAQSTSTTLHGLLRRQSESDDTIPAVCVKPCTGINGCGEDDVSSCCDTTNNNILANCANCLVAQGTVALSLAQTNYQEFLDSCAASGTNLKKNTINGSFKGGSAGRVATRSEVLAGTVALGLGLGYGVLA
ncbi:hypothetical protein MKEN_00154200 [Mycena kentingensis (nom. inval.)]|nr:hypothetical protein MKEN_00154200 [Mycena kentingensis (nom. inval.)]